MEANARARVTPRSPSVRVEGAALHERLEDGLVHALGVDARGEVEEIVEGAALLRASKTRLERRAAEPAHRAEPEADLRSERVLDLARLRGGRACRRSGACRRP